MAARLLLARGPDDADGDAAFVLCPPAKIWTTVRKEVTFLLHVAQAPHYCAAEDEKDVRILRGRSRDGLGIKKKRVYTVFYLSQPSNCHGSVRQR